MSSAQGGGEKEERERKCMFDVLCLMCKGREGGTLRKNESDLYE